MLQCLAGMLVLSSSDCRCRSSASRRSCSSHNPLVELRGLKRLVDKASRLGDRPFRRRRHAGLVQLVAHRLSFCLASRVFLLRPGKDRRNQDDGALTEWASASSFSWLPNAPQGPDGLANGHFSTRLRHSSFPLRFPSNTGGWWSSSQSPTPNVWRLYRRVYTTGQQLVACPHNLRLVNFLTLP